MCLGEGVSLFVCGCLVAFVCVLVFMRVCVVVFVCLCLGEGVSLFVCDCIYACLCVCGCGLGVCDNFIVQVATPLQAADYV